MCSVVEEEQKELFVIWIAPNDNVQVAVENTSLMRRRTWYGLKLVSYLVEENRGDLIDLSIELEGIWSKSQKRVEQV